MSRRRNNRRRNNRRNVQVPAAKSAQITNRGALRSITLTHREYVQQIVVSEGGGPNQVTKIPLQPGLETSFPWLSAISRRFESYRFTRLMFEYIPDVGSTTDGSLAICPDYDPADDNQHASKATLLSFEDAVRGPLWTPLRMVCSPRNLRKRTSWYTRGETQIGDVKLTDAGNLWLSLSYEGDQTTIGELWVTYTIVLITPQLEQDPTERFVGTKLYDSDQYESPFAGLVVRDNTLNDALSIIAPKAFEIYRPGLYQFMYYVQPLIDMIPGQYFNPQWMAPLVPTQEYGDSGLVQDTHTVSATDTGVNTDGETFKVTIIADNTTTQDNPLKVTWTGLTSWGAAVSEVAYNVFSMIRLYEDVKGILGQFKAHTNFVKALPRLEAQELIETHLARVTQARVRDTQRR